MGSEGKITRVSPSVSHAACYLLEIDVSKGDARMPPVETSGEHRSQAKERVTFDVTLCSELTDSLPREMIETLLAEMTFQRIPGGDIFIRQGEEAEEFYLILKGSCSVRLEKGGIAFQIARLGPGDLVGEMAVFTGEKRGASVEADTDMDVLRMSREQFERLSQQYPEFRRYLSEIVTHRLSTSKITAEKKIGKYVITEKIGDGGSSILYRGVHGTLGLPVAIKMLKHEMAMDPDFIELFSNEAKIIAQLNHPNIVRVYDIEELYRTVFIVMEYLEGVTLREVLDDTGKMPLDRALPIVLGVCAGLDYAHRAGIIHQDINPRNIFLLADGGVKIIDFGLACRIGSVDTNFLFPGTIYYISPEQIKGDPVNERTDLYSLGVTVYELLTGTLPIAGDDMRALINWHLHEEIGDTRPSFPELPDEIHAFFGKTIRRDPAERFNTVSEAIALLRPLAERFGLPSDAAVCARRKGIGMFLSYDDQVTLEVKRLVEEFSRQVEKAGACVKIAPFEDIP